LFIFDDDGHNLPTYQVIASSCSFDKLPGTIVTGIGNVPELLDN
jgi:hypothetical protein